MRTYTYARGIEAPFLIGLATGNTNAVKEVGRVICLRTPWMTCCTGKRTLWAGRRMLTPGRLEWRSVICALAVECDRPAFPSYFGQRTTDHLSLHASQTMDLLKSLVGFSSVVGNRLPRSSAQANEPDVGILLSSSLLRLDYFRVIVMASVFLSLKHSAGTTPWNGLSTKAPHILNTG